MHAHRKVHFNAQYFMFVLLKTFKPHCVPFCIDPMCNPIFMYNPIRLRNNLRRWYFLYNNDE